MVLKDDIWNLNVHEGVIFLSKLILCKSGVVQLYVEEFWHKRIRPDHISRGIFCGFAIWISVSVSSSLSSALLCSEFAWPKINNLISGPKNLGWRCHVNSCKKRISILSILDGKDGARMGLRFVQFWWCWNMRTHDLHSFSLSRTLEVGSQLSNLSCVESQYILANLQYHHVDHLYLWSSKSKR